jgi:uncharacterized protein DUF4157
MWGYGRSRSPEASDQPPATTRTRETSEARRADHDADSGARPTGTGERLPEGVQRYMEDRFGSDLGEVRVHTDSDAQALTSARGASAVSIDREIYFAKGMYAPGSTAGRALLAHEIAHSLQQKLAAGGGTADSANAEAEAQRVARAMEEGEPLPAIATAARGPLHDVGWAQRGPLPDPYGELFLLNSFAKKFLAAARLIFANPAAMKLVDEAEKGGIDFGGYAEDGPAPTLGRAYTSGRAVYVPRTSTDAVVAMRDFLFELNNALREPKFKRITEQAQSKAINAREFARQMVEQEVEGMLRVGEIWFETKKAQGRSGTADTHDPQFFLSDYESVRAGRMTKADLVRAVLARTYDTGTLRGKTVEQYYMDRYPGK